DVRRDARAASQTRSLRAGLGFEPSAVPTGASQGVPAPLLPRPALLAPRRPSALRYSGAPQLRGHRRPGTAERPAMPAKHLPPRRAWVDLRLEPGTSTQARGRSEGVSGHAQTAA